MPYEHFAYVYDALMTDAPYEKWTDFVNEQARKSEIKERKLLDLACGTGELSIRLAESGWQVTGVDIAEDMLTVAQQKAHASGLPIHFYKQDMTKLEGLEQYDVITIFCDSLNYIRDEDELQNVFSSIFKFLKEDGLFMFDVHTVYKMEELFIGQTYALNDEELSYIWQCFAGETPHTVEHELTFFIKEKHVYERFDEMHIQRTFPEEMYEQWLASAGFTVERKYYDFQAEKHDQNERLFFVAKKSSGQK